MSRCLPTALAARAHNNNYYYNNNDMDILLDGSSSLQKNYQRISRLELGCWCWFHSHDRFAVKIPFGSLVSVSDKEEEERGHAKETSL
jgi:hypothetical protein